MSTNETKGKAFSFAKDRMAIALPLIGLSVLWLAFLLAQYTDLFVRNPWQTPTGEYDVSLESVHPSTYIFLVGIAAVAFTSVWAKSLAHRAGDTKLAKAAHGYTIIAVIASLIIGVIYGFGQFGSAFGYADNAQHNQLVRILGVYVPILLDAALLVFVILKAFVGQKADEEDE